MTGVAPAGWVLVGAPSNAGARQPGQERAPAALRAAGLVERLAEAGVDVVDLGDHPTILAGPDEAHPTRQNLDLVVQAALRTAASVEEALSLGRRPLVVGGDCTLSLGVVAALVGRSPDLGLLYFDADLDLNTPETSPSGIFDGMVVAHLLGRGEPRLAGLGPRLPLLAEEQVALFAYDADSGYVDPPELESLARSRLASYPLARVRADPVAAARAAWEALGRRSDAILVHFDVDVTSLPAADLPHPGGLDCDAAFAALGVFLGAPSCAGLVVTELNPTRDPDGAQAERIVGGLVESLAAGSSASDR